MFRKSPALEQYLFNQVEGTVQIPELLKAEEEQRKAEDEKNKVLSAIVVFEQKRLELPTAIQDGNNHTGPGVLNIFGKLMQYTESMNLLDQILPNKKNIFEKAGYKITIYKDKLKEVAKYTVDWCNEALKGLFFIYGEKAEEYVRGLDSLFGEARLAYKNF